MGAHPPSPESITLPIIRISNYARFIPFPANVEMITRPLLLSLSPHVPHSSHSAERERLHDVEEVGVFTIWTGEFFGV
jgi:hypothetical protein